jgi:hypothetical protein
MELERVDAIIEEGPGDVRNRSIEEIRSLRAEAQTLEAGLSFVRRIVQGRLDIVGAELARRKSGGPPTDVADLVASLPDILSDRVRAPGLGRLPQILAPADMSGLMREVDEIAHVDTLTALGGQSDLELDQLATDLGDYEKSVSAKRRSLHDVIDAVQAELTRRYKTGEASVESLLQ